MVVNVTDHHEMMNSANADLDQQYPGRKPSTFLNCRYPILQACLTAEQRRYSEWIGGHERKVILTRALRRQHTDNG